MRYPASEKLEIIRIVEQAHLPAKETLDRLGIARRTFYRWYDRYLEGGPEALEDRPSSPSRVWNRIPAHIHDQIIELALEQSELSPRELAVRFTDEKRYFVSEATVYRLLKAHDLITSPAYVVIKAADGPVSNFVREAVFRHQMTNLSPKITANWVFASVHSRGGLFHSAAA